MIIKGTGKINFTVQSGWQNKLELNLHVLDLKIDGNHSMQDYAYFSEELQEGSYRQDDIEGLNLSELSDEHEYEAEIEFEINSTSSYYYWSGGTEYDVDVSLTIKSHKDLGSMTETMFGGEMTNNYTNIFQYSTNNDGDYIKMRHISPEKLFVEVGHCCVRRKMFLHPMALTKLLAEHKDNSDEHN